MLLPLVTGLPQKCFFFHSGAALQTLNHAIKSRSHDAFSLSCFYASLCLKKKKNLSFHVYSTWSPPSKLVSIAQKQHFHIQTHYGNMKLNTNCRCLYCSHDSIPDRIGLLQQIPICHYITSLNYIHTLQSTCTNTPCTVLTWWSISYQTPSYC